MKYYLGKYDINRKLGVIRNLAIILTLSYSMSFGQSGNNVIIDDFSNDQPIVFVTLAGTNPDGSSVAAANTVGGERDLSVEVSDGSNANAEVLGGTFNLSVGAQSTGSATIVYDGVDGDPFATNFTGLNNLDLTNGGTEDRYKISVISADHPGNFTIEVYTDGANSSSVTKEFAENMDPTSFEIFFNEFTSATGNGADFTNVGAIVIRATGEPEIDLIIDRICTEGPPPTCGLTNIAAAGPSCIQDNFTDYTVTVSWTGVDDSVTLTAGGSGSPASVTTSVENGSQTFTYPLTESYNITFSDSEGLCTGLGSGLSGNAPACAAPPACELESITAAAPTCIDNNFTDYTVTVSWIGADASVTLTAGGSGSPASITTTARDGSQTFTYPQTESYNITYTDSEGLCTGLGSGLSGDAPTCAAPPACELESITAAAPTCIDNNFTDYTVTVSWIGADASVTLTAGGSGSPASITTSARDGSQTFTYPQTESYNITYTDSEGLCTGLGSGLSGDAPTCAPPPACELFNLSGEKNCLGESQYTVTVSWTGSDESVTLTAGGSGSPASVTTTAENGSHIFTYPITEDYNITVSDTEGLCTGNISGTNPSCFSGVPTMGEWGLISLSLIFLIFGTMAMRKYVFTPSVTK